MKPIPIYKDHIGRWREQNPHRKPKYIDQVPYIQSESNKLWLKFERSIQRYDFPNSPEVKPGEVVMAYLAHQCKVWSPGEGYHWVTQKNVRRRDDGSVISIAGGDIESRDIWVAANQEIKDACECGVPEAVHGTSCGWANACYTIDAETDEEKGWNREWVKAHPQIHLSGESTFNQEGKEEQAKDFQGRVLDWLIKCFGIEIAKDILERNDRFIEESLELAQSLNYSADRAHALVDYVFDRDKGEPFQEVGGVMVTLAALCSATGLNMMQDGEIEFARINNPEIIDKIRKKQAAKPTGSALPIASNQSTKDAKEIVELREHIHDINGIHEVEVKDLRGEVERLRNALIDIKKHQEIIISEGNLHLSSVWTIATRALKVKP